MATLKPLAWLYTHKGEERRHVTITRDWDPEYVTGSLGFTETPLYGPATDDALVEAAAKAILGPHEPVPPGSRYTLEELREARWALAEDHQRKQALWSARAAVAAISAAITANVHREIDQQKGTAHGDAS